MRYRQGWTVALALIMGLSSGASPGAASADGSFFQLDLANRGGSFTRLVRRGPASLTLDLSEFATGSAATLWGSYGVSLGDGAWLPAGPA